MEMDGDADFNSHICAERWPKAKGISDRVRASADGYSAACEASLDFT